MALEACAECGKDVSSEAKSCPHCGVNRESGFAVVNRVGGNVGVILAVLFVAFLLFALVLAK